MLPEEQARLADRVQRGREEAATLSPSTPHNRRPEAGLATVEIVGFGGQTVGNMIGYAQYN